MISEPSQKYTPASIVSNPERVWPSKRLESAPRWCSTDLRDGNQALANPMDHDRKLMYFDHLVQCGFKEIEVAFPSASDTEFQFVRKLIEKDHIPDDVWVQVITQARPDLIRMTIDSLRGAKQAIVHVYNATAPVFRDVVFQNSKEKTIQLALDAVELIKQLCEEQPETTWCLEYSPETFCFTELEFALEICEAVKDSWCPSESRQLILNLPTTVEVNTPNVFADQIELFIRNFSDLNNVTISIHPHNDRGTGVATAELGVLGGAQRIEGCLFGNGERTGNVDLVTLAMNLYSQGVNPNIKFENIKKTVEVAEYCNRIPVHPRHPYAGELVFTAFSGSHQDAIKKGFAKRFETGQATWNVPYLPIDPIDIGCAYEEVIRVNNQSGKSGAAWLIEQNHGLKLPRSLQVDFSEKVKSFTNNSGCEMNLSEIWRLFRESYGVLDKPDLQLIDYESKSESGELCIIATLNHKGCRVDVEGLGSGIMSALVNGIKQAFDIDINIKDYSEHTLGLRTESRAVTYVEIQSNLQRSYFGVSINSDSLKALLQATLNAVCSFLDQYESFNQVD
ncbi:TPA: 2-isopropylmalate synthase [Vibrio parahaemolyticus]|nr:2-isopropylmalate synthase [Vibrio parahaemolyticus]HCE1981214.1 2-isopropylmalate synthase [Vibrio parahaemolyticus]HCE3381100.1 2-isopropylmalate synthase [Vibrio parahaemolyticus]HCG6659933.1 2-isopropylmalate synthase [Vibrio parahaemolyticus]HCH0944041.1 2-isopropylmalate synthase [Vibrio parahaemolyticus]